MLRRNLTPVANTAPSPAMTGAVRPVYNSKPASRQGSNPDEIEIGCKVNHPKWGIGTVVTKEGSGAEAQVKIAFPGLGIKSLILAYANLEKIE